MISDGGGGEECRRALGKEEVLILLIADLQGKSRRVAPSSFVVAQGTLLERAVAERLPLKDYLTTLETRAL